MIEIIEMNKAEEKLLNKKVAKLLGPGIFRNRSYGMDDDFAAPPPFCTSIEAAWEVVKRLTSDRVSFSVHKTRGIYGARFCLDKKRGEFSTADTAEKAICFAAVKFYEEEVG